MSRQCQSNEGIFQPTAHSPIVIERGDRIINLCEMKFCIGPYTIKKPYADEVRQRNQLFKEKEKTNYGLNCTFVTTFGVTDGVNIGATTNTLPCAHSSP